MSYHNLDSANYPDLHPTAPVRDVEMQPQPSRNAAPAQPVYYQPEDYSHIPYATPDIPCAQPVGTAVPVALPAGAAVPVALPVGAAPLVALPVSRANVVPGLYVPPPLTPEELDVVLERQVPFRGCQYFRESRVFFKRNWCKLMTATLMWGVVFLTLGCAIHRISPTHGVYGGYGSYVPHNYPSTATEPPATTTTTFMPPAATTASPVPPATYHSSSAYYQYEDSSQPEYENFAVAQPARSKSFLQMVLLGLLSILIGMPAMAGMNVAVFKAMKTNGPLRFKDFFSCFRCRYYCRLIPLSVTLKLVTAILSVLILPAIWFAFVTIFAVPLHREHKFLGTCKAIQASMKIVHRYFCSMLGFVLLNALLQFCGFLCFGVGLLVTIPLSFVALCYCYNDLIGVNGMPMLIGA